MSQWSHFNIKYAILSYFIQLQFTHSTRQFDIKNNLVARQNILFVALEEERLRRMELRIREGELRNREETMKKEEEREASKTVTNEMTDSEQFEEMSEILMFGLAQHPNKGKTKPCLLVRNLL